MRDRWTNEGTFVCLSTSFIMTLGGGASCWRPVTEKQRWKVLQLRLELQHREGSAFTVKTNVPTGSCSDGHDGMCLCLSQMW